VLEAVLRSAEKAWRYGLSRRSSTSAIGWEKFQQLLETYVLPPPRIVHNISWAMQGSTVRHQSGKEVCPGYSNRGIGKRAFELPIDLASCPVLVTRLPSIVPVP